MYVAKTFLLWFLGKFQEGLRGKRELKNDKDQPKDGSNKNPADAKQSTGKSVSVQSVGKSANTRNRTVKKWQNPKSKWQEKKETSGRAKSTTIGGAQSQRRRKNILGIAGNLVLGRVKKLRKRGRM